MPSRRYTIVIADRTSGLVRRVTISLRMVGAVLSIIVGLPILIGLGAKFNADYELQQLKASNEALSVENTNYRETTGELTTQIQSLEGVIEELGDRSKLDPEQARAMSELPAVVKARAAGGVSPQTQQSAAAISNILSSSFVSPEDTFGALRTLLQGLESRLRNVRKYFDRQEDLSSVTP
jgi:hypothetical protein